MASYSSFIKYSLLSWILYIIPHNPVEGLECYACSNQDSNVDKCIKTTKQCEQHENICMSRVKWGLPPYWIPYGERQHYVWKDCAEKSQCHADSMAMMPYCKRDWFDDWQCIECCTGDMCNFYVTLGSAARRGSAVLVALCAVAAGLLRGVWGRV